MSRRLGRTSAVPAVLLASLLVAFLSGCFGEDAPPSPANTEAALPRFVPADQSLADLVGTTFSAETLPADLGGADATAIAGSEIIGSPADAGDTVALHWSVSGDTAGFAFSELVDADATEPMWRTRSVWQLLLGPDMVVSVGTNVCKPDPQSHDPNNSRFLAVTNPAQDRAFAAWVLYESGPTPYTPLDTLDCERFVP